MPEEDQLGAKMSSELSSSKLLEVIHIHRQIVLQGLDLAGLMTLVVERSMGLVNADGAAIELIDGSDMVYRAVSGITRQSLGLRIPVATSLSGKCILDNALLSCSDSELDPRVDVAACRATGLRSMIVVPLRHHDMVVGVLKATSRSVAKFDEHDMELLLLLSDVVGAAMHFAAEYGKDELLHRATHDELTGLVNRYLLSDKLRSLMSLHERDDDGFALLVIDMDGLKRINDTLGHAAGDAALCELARRLTAAARLNDVVARVGGDEFAMILNPVPASQGVQLLASRIGEAIRGRFTYEGRELSLSASIGAARYPEDGTDICALMESADARMYKTKANPR